MTPEERKRAKLVEAMREKATPLPKGTTREQDNANHMRRKMENYERRPRNTLQDMLSLFLEPEPFKREPQKEELPDTNDNYETSEGYEYNEHGRKVPRKSLFKKIFD